MEPHSVLLWMTNAIVVLNIWLLWSKQMNSGHPFFLVSLGVLLVSHVCLFFGFFKTLIALIALYWLVVFLGLGLLGYFRRMISPTIWMGGRED
jgi:hypothetical protein